MAEDIKPGRYAIRVTNHETGQVWSIHDTHGVCESEKARVLKEWGKDNCTIDGPIPITED